jgi:hypothetical protein
VVRTQVAVANRWGGSAKVPAEEASTSDAARAQLQPAEACKSDASGLRQAEAECKSGASGFHRRWMAAECKSDASGCQ